MTTTASNLPIAPAAAKQRWVLALTSVASLMVGLDILVVTTTLTTIHRQLGASLGELEWIINAYTLSFAVLLMTASALGDRFGRRRLFLAGLSLFTVMSAACALAPSIGWLIAARAVQGAGSAMIMPHAMALLSAAYPPQKRAKALGIFSGVTGLAILGGPMIGGAVVQGLSWPWIFWLNVPIGLVVIPLARRKIDESRGRAAQLDAGGVVLVTAAALGLVWGLVRGNTAGWGSAEVLGALAGRGGCHRRVRRLGTPHSGADAADAAVPVPVLRRRERGRVRHVRVDLRRRVLPGPVLPDRVALRAARRPGLRLAPWTVTLSLVAPVAGALAARVGDRALITAGLSLQAAGFVWIALVAREHLGYAAIVAPLVLAGCGVSMAMVAAQNCVIGAVPPADIGQGVGHLQHPAPAGRDVRDRHPGRGVHQHRQLRLGPGLRGRFRPRGRRSRPGCRWPERWPGRSSRPAAGPRPSPAGPAAPTPVLQQASGTEG